MTTPFDNIKGAVDLLAEIGFSDCSDEDFRFAAMPHINAIHKALTAFMKSETRVFSIANTDGDLIEDTILWSDVLSTELASKESDLARLQAENARLRDALEYFAKLEWTEDYTMPTPNVRVFVSRHAILAARKAMEGGE